MLRPYTPSNHVSASALILMLLLGALAAAISGALLWYVERWLYLIIAFPIIVAALCGTVVSFVVKRAKVRAPLLVALIGALAGVAALGVYRGLNYTITFRDEIHQELANEGFKGLTPEREAQMTDELLESETGSTGFVGYLKLLASQGMTIENRGSEFDLDERGTWILWGVELLFTVLIAAAIPYRAAKEPFNEDSGEWYPKAEPLGFIAWKERKTLRDAVQSANWSQVAALLGAPPAKPPFAGISIQRSASTPQSDAVISVVHVTRGRYGNTTNTVTRGMISPFELSLITGKKSN